MRDSTALPDLRVLPTALLLPHEDCDPLRIERLSRRILEEGILKNPPVVAAIPGTPRYIVLDGANRSMAFTHLNIPHIVAQLVSYEDPGVSIDTWYHVVAGMPLQEFEDALQKVGDLIMQESTHTEARRALEAGEAVAYIVGADGVRTVYSASNQPTPTLSLLTEIVGVYKGKAEIYRASNDIWEIQKPYYPHISALIIFPRLEPEDIMHAARNGERVPSGITRHIIAARALNINIPIGILMTDWPIERKSEWLQEWLMGRMAANAIRFYAESTFSFNE